MSVCLWVGGWISERLLKALLALAEGAEELRQVEGVEQHLVLSVERQAARLSNWSRDQNRTCSHHRPSFSILAFLRRTILPTAVVPLTLLPESARYCFSLGLRLVERADEDHLGWAERLLQAGHLNLLASPRWVLIDR